MKALELSLYDIAAWSSCSKIPQTEDKRNISIPALQRGLVWKPKQIELLWDSLMRGIPVGSFVVCEHIAEQQRTDEDLSCYHLLDGQQRANAIQLGFAEHGVTPAETDDIKSILWLDIAPTPLPNESSRNFLFRVTTSAHPWGYTKGDGEGYLGARVVSDWLKKHMSLCTSEPDYSRPTPSAMQPIEANMPIPMSLLVSAFDKKDKTLRKAVLIESMRPFGERKWAKDALTKIEAPRFDLEPIARGISTALETTILALQAPSELLEASKQETNNDDRASITNIEHLFQRLNQQGTRLDGEELTYSLIKAYWPKLTRRIDDISKIRMPASRLISLAIRVIRTEENNSNNKLASGQSVSSIRKLASDKSFKQVREKILTFINSNTQDGLEECCQRVDRWLGTHPGTTWGLPPVLRTSIAYQQQDIYLVLLLLARKNVSELPDDLCTALTGAVTYCAWFGSDQKAIAEALYGVLANQEVNVSRLALALAAAKSYLYPLNRRDDVQTFIKLPDPASADFKSWNWCQLVLDVDKDVKEAKQRRWWNFLCAIKDRKELLLYAQRNYLVTRFKNYDPARKDLWETHNRPWDYDHILPHAYTYNIKKDNLFMDFCKQWCNTIGNYRAWPFEDNRSDQDIKAGKKLNESLMEKSFILPDKELAGFDQDRNILSDANAALAFAESCKSRIVRIYDEWYKNLMLAEIVKGDVNND